jgi:hypothetical protein
MNTPTRPATPDDERPIEHPALRPPRLPTFFADPITGLPTELPTDDAEPSEAAEEAATLMLDQYADEIGAAREDG